MQQQAGYNERINSALLLAPRDERQADEHGPIADCVQLIDTQGLLVESIFMLTSLIKGASKSVEASLQALPALWGSDTSFTMHVGFA